MIMAGLYIHIPFCKSRCIYCGFYSTTHLELRQRYIDALCREMEIIDERLKTEDKSINIETIYIGGGTPSQLSDSQLRQLFSYIYKVYGLSQTIEVTLECNPDDVTDEFADLLSHLPVNRVSMGAQSFNDDRLRFLHRRHTSTQIPIAVKRLRQVGFGNISIDLMYGFPEETIENWHRDIDTALDLGVEHLSAYALQYEEGTTLCELLKRKKIKKLDEETERRMYYDLIDSLENAGYEHYEISNFAKPGFRSRHNSNYWNQTPYIGLGAAAHSYDGIKRQWNVSSVRDYIEGIESKSPYIESEMISGDVCYNELVMTALRTREGLSLNLLTPQQQTYCLAQAQRYINTGLLCFDHLQQRLRITRKGLFVSDMVMADLFIA